MKYRVGEEFITKQNYSVIIIKYEGYKNCTIKFKDGTILENIRYDHLQNGLVNNPLHPSLFNRGYLGIGIRNSIIQSKWSSMFSRCYSEKYHLKYPTYKDCSVHPDWHNFQVFAEWFEQNYNPGYMEDWHLDKDILFKGNKIYSPETCCFVPEDINQLLVKNNSKRGQYPIGVTYIKNLNSFNASIKKYNIRMHLGNFTTPEEAFEAYKIAKEDYIKKVAEKYKEQITKACYQALINYKVEIND